MGISTIGVQSVVIKWPDIAERSNIFIAEAAISQNIDYTFITVIK